MKSSQKTLALWFMIALLIVTTLHVWRLQPPQKEVQISYSELLAALEAKGVESVAIQDETYTGKFKPEYRLRSDIQAGSQFTAVGPLYSDKAFELLTSSDAKIEFQRRRESPFWQQFLISWLPMLLLFGFFFFSMKQIQMGGGRAMSFGRSRARLLVENQKKVTFEDVAGIDEAKEELEEIIEFLKDPKKFTRLGGRIPKGVLLMGAPGTGKTLLARAIAGEAGVPFFSISGSDFVEMFVGVGAARVRDLFEQGKKNAPCIVFIDEIDAVGRHRGAGLGGGHDEREQTLNQLLVEMDGFESNEGVIIIAATNRPDVLDPALLRPGRFDRRIVVPRPDVKGREGILKIHTKRITMAERVELGRIARGTPGFSGADLEAVVNEAALLAARQNKAMVEMHDFEMAKDKVLMGSERKSLMITPEEKRHTAFHEAGHALVAKLIPGTDPVHKVSIIPRGAALGVTQQLPTDDRYTQSKSFCENNIAVLMGGRAAEEIVFAQPTTGAGNDIERATELARKMVCEWGMSDVLGPLAFGKREEMIFLGKEITQAKDYSDTTAREIDAEIKRIVTTNYDRAHQLLIANRKSLDAMAEALLEREVIDGDQIDRLIRGERLEPMPMHTVQSPAAQPAPTTARSSELPAGAPVGAPVTGKA
ncbi:MAG: ATP-dependent metallopeptidase FtsH/Yme1/Tma family protein [Deltaproteobacteria bacterium]|nr:ATP-dependent metallopeptidase FtsH/Yme1/Tma family protein [Deltaproteobacteria bacterium]